MANGGLYGFVARHARIGFAIYMLGFRDVEGVSF